MGEDRGASGRIRIGPAGWSSPDWEGQVYPKPRGFNPLRYLAPYFDMIGINSTFYRIPSASMAKLWVQRVAAHPAFRFTAKLCQGFTHTPAPPVALFEAVPAALAASDLTAH